MNKVRSDAHVKWMVFSIPKQTNILRRGKSCIPFGYGNIFTRRKVKHFLTITQKILIKTIKMQLTYFLNSTVNSKFLCMILRCDVGVLKCHGYNVDGRNFNGAY